MKMKMKMKKKLKTEVKAVIVLMIIVIATILAFLTFSLGMDKLGSQFLLIVLPYFFFVIFLKYCYSKWPSRFLKVFCLIISFPLDIVGLFAVFTGSTFRLLSNIIFYFLFSIMIPAGLIMALDKLSILHLSQNTMLFLLLTFGSIISITFNKFLLRYVYILMPLSEKVSDNIEVYKAPTEYVIKPDNIRFLIYAFYFIYLFIYSLKLIEENTIFSSFSRDNAIMQAFVVFLAYDSLRYNSKDLKIRASHLLSKIIEVFTVDDIANDKIENKDEAGK
jgi:hypothetical protein